MLVATINKARRTIMVQGDVIDIAKDVCHLIAGLYEKLEDDSGRNVTREAFRMALVAFLTKDDSPLFTVSSEEESEASR